MLEIGSGSGQHLVHFAAHFPLATFQPSDIDQDYLKSIQAHIDEYEVNAFTKNLLPPLTLDLTAPFTLREQSFDFVYCSNLIHITPIECTQRLFALAEHVLRPEGSLITYGPYALPGGGRITPESNRRFHANLQMQNSRWGLRGIDELASIASAHQMRLRHQFDMPFNNKVLWWQKRKNWWTIARVFAFDWNNKTQSWSKDLDTDESRNRRLCRRLFILLSFVYPLGSSLYFSICPLSSCSRSSGRVLVRSMRAETRRRIANGENTALSTNISPVLF